MCEINIGPPVQADNTREAQRAAPALIEAGMRLNVPEARHGPRCHDQRGYPERPCERSWWRSFATPRGEPSTPIGEYLDANGYLGFGIAFCLRALQEGVSLALRVVAFGAGRDSGPRPVFIERAIGCNLEATAKTCRWECDLERKREQSNDYSTGPKSDRIRNSTW